PRAWWDPARARPRGRRGAPRTPRARDSRRRGPRASRRPRRPASAGRAGGAGGGRRRGRSSRRRARTRSRARRSRPPLGEVLEQQLVDERVATAAALEEDEPRRVVEELDVAPWSVPAAGEHPPDGVVVEVGQAAAAERPVCPEVRGDPGAYQHCDRGPEP